MTIMKENGEKRNSLIPSRLRARELKCRRHIFYVDVSFGVLVSVADCAPHAVADRTRVKANNRAINFFFMVLLLNIRLFVSQSVKLHVKCSQIYIFENYQ